MISGLSVLSIYMQVRQSSKLHSEQTHASLFSTLRHSIPPATIQHLAALLYFFKICLWLATFSQFYNSI